MNMQQFLNLNFTEATVIIEKKYLGFFYFFISGFR